MITRNMQVAGDGRLTHIAVNQHHTLATVCQGNRKVYCDVALPFAGDRGGNQDSLAIAGCGKELQVGSQRLVSFCKLERCI